jgi:hypothetical protein
MRNNHFRRRAGALLCIIELTLVPKRPHRLHSDPTTGGLETSAARTAQPNALDAFLHNFMKMRSVSEKRLATEIALR